MATSRKDPCPAQRQAVNDAKQALAENKDWQKDRLKNAREKLDKIFRLTKNKLDDPDYAMVSKAASNVFYAAKKDKVVDGFWKARLDIKANVINDEEISGAASSLASLVEQYVQAVNEQPGLEQALEKAKEALKACEAESAATEATTGAVPGLCYASRTGHGHVGEPCHVRLGKDSICQHHGPRDQVMVA